MNKATTSSYRQIIKATSMFGGVQLLIVFTAAVKAKIVAVLLGPSGMGIVSLLTSTTGFVTRVTECGLSISAVRNVSAANAENDQQLLAEVVAVLRHLVWITGGAGMLITFFGAPWLSQLAFGSDEYTWAFRWISVTLLLMQLSKGQKVVLQGLRHINRLAKANMWGNLLGLLVSIPVYYIWRLDGIIPVIVLTAAFGIASSWYYASKVKLAAVKVSLDKIRKHGAEMLYMGILLSLNGVIATAATYVLRIFISQTGGVGEVGLFNAGFTITGIYIGTIFTGIMTDFFPRLSSVANDNKRSSDLINQQAEVAVLLLAPLLSLSMVYISVGLPILFSREFSVVEEMVQWIGMGMYFRALSYSIILIFLARGQTRIYFWNEVIYSAYTLAFNLVGYKLGGLNGLGFSFLVSYVVYLVHILALVKAKSSFSLDPKILRVFFIQVALGGSCFALSHYLPPVWGYVAGTAVAAISFYISWKVLSQKTGIAESGILKKINKFFKKGEN